MAEDRIQKILSARGVCSRRAAEAMIAAGRVTVNGEVASLGAKADDAHDVIAVDGEPLGKRKKNAEHTYLLLNKPRGYITTAKDERGRKTVLELVAGVPARLYPVGRLDKDSEGLLLLTDDGALTNKLTHPSAGITKVYRVTVRPRATEQQLAQLASGVDIGDGETTLPALVRVLSEDAARSVLEFAISEGKNRQIRRMCEAVGLTVARLRRNSLGPLRLGMLKSGQYRPLSAAELAALRRAVAKKGEQDE